MSLRRYFPSFLSRSKRVTSGVRRLFRPALEALEDRLVLNHPLSAIPALHSDPAAAAKLYLDFDGHFESTWGGWYDPVLGTHWGGWENVTTPAYDTDGDPTTFSDGELAAIREIWARVAEDYAPFNLDVTTVDPGNFADRVGMRIAIGGSSMDWYGSPTFGVTIFGSYTDPTQVNTGYVFSDNVSGDPRLVADGVSHEAGHAYGLAHQSTFDANGNKIQEYSTNGDSTVVAPLMGDPSRAARSTWWYGLNHDGNWQDDMAIIASANNGFGYRADDHGDTFATASSLTADGASWSVSGIIEQPTDRDVFRLDTGGSITVRVDPAAFGPNLDPTVSLFDSAGNLIASAEPNATDPGDLSAELTATVASGTYYVVVGSHGDYGDVGQYTVTVNPPTVQFATASQNVREGETVNIAVELSSASNGTVTVPYTVTVPDSLPQQQRATPGADFQGALSGTLTFGPGVTTQTLSFTLVDDGLVEADVEYFAVTLGAAATGATLGTPSTTLVGIIDNDLPIVPDATPDPQRLRQAALGFAKSTEHYIDFVTEAYRHFLGRAPDDGEVRSWVGLMQLYETSNHTQGLRQEQVEADFLASGEYIGRSGGVGEAWIRGIYRDVLGREGDQAEIDNWMAILAHGAAPLQVALGFTGSDERLRDRVAETYRTLLDRQPDPGELGQWVSAIKAGATMEDVVAGFLVSNEYYSRQSGAAGNPARWVRSVYLDVLFRPAGRDEMDPWLRFLDS
jgi:hypothetical protein